jgi:hypothetical protein
MNRRYAREQQLPLKTRQDLASSASSEQLHVLSLRLFEAGWTIRSISEAFSPPKSRSTVQYWIKMGKESFSDVSVDVPTPSYRTHEDGYQRLTPVSPGIKSDVASELRELANLARYYRSGMSSTSVQAVANRQLNSLIVNLVSKNIKVAEIARACGVTHRAIARRLENSEN